jgi:energy-coupling factor transporter ATP-binding protein EcfA2
MSRKINLTCIHAINWFGYNDVLDVYGNLVIAGITGSGKSVLMDVIQLVLVGDQKAKYNQSATGSASTRSLKSYCLGDTKQDIEGSPQYMREKGSITYVALEFEWPDRKRVETWGLRIEYDSAANSQPSRRTGFLIDRRVEKSFWLNPDRTPLDFTAFKRAVKSLEDSELYETMDSYRREMALPSHLNFDRGTLDYLLPTAMSFTFLKSFNAFCRDYILPTHQVDIQPVKESFQAFRSLERELGILCDQMQRLQVIQATDCQRAEAERDQKIWKYLEVELRAEAAAEEREDFARQVVVLEEALGEDRQRLAQLDAETARLKEEMDALKAALNATEEGKLFLSLRKRNRELVTEIERLKGIGQTVDETVQSRIRQAHRWIKLIASLPIEVVPGALKDLAHSVEQLGSGSKRQLRDQVRLQARAAQSLRQTVENAARDLFAEETRLQKEHQRLTELLSALKLGAIPEASILLNALNHALPARGNKRRALALRELCEVRDEEWRAAVETAFTRKFAVVISPEDYDQAESIYHELKSEANRESLINPRDALELKGTIREGSLAEKMETDHPVAQAILRHSFGELMCVDQPMELRQHARAILRDGFMYQRPFVERRAHYQNNPCIGLRGIEKQKVHLQTQLEDLQMAQRILEPKVRLIREFLEFPRLNNLLSESLEEDLAEALLLEDRQAELQRNIEAMRPISDLDFAQKEQAISDCDQRSKGLSSERDELLQSSKQSALATLKNKLREAEALEVSAREDLTQAMLDTALLPHMVRKLEMRDEVLTSRPVKALAVDLCKDKASEAGNAAYKHRTDLGNLRKELAMHHTIFQEFDPEALTNEAYDARLAKIAESDIKIYEEKSRRERSNWQNLFRTQVLSKLHAALHEVENLLALLNQELRTPIGNSRYQIVRKPNPEAEYEIYRNLVDSSRAAQEDELFFASLDESLRQTIENIFEQLSSQTVSAGALAFLDYRNYHDYDMHVSDPRDPEGRPSSVDRHSGKFSGGENQSPYFIAILACYLRAYHRYEKRRKDPSLALVPIDEAFSKLSGERIKDCIDALKALDLQGVFSMSSGNIPYALDMCDQMITVMKVERTEGRRHFIRNIPVPLTREEAIKRYGSTSDS